MRGRIFAESMSGFVCGGCMQPAAGESPDCALPGHQCQRYKRWNIKARNRLLGPARPTRRKRTTETGKKSSFLRRFSRLGRKAVGAHIPFSASGECSGALRVGGPVAQHVSEHHRRRRSCTSDEGKKGKTDRLRRSIATETAERPARSRSFGARDGSHLEQRVLVESPRAGNGGGPISRPHIEGSAKIVAQKSPACLATGRAPSLI